jgi:NAD(P)-dependent dehydrogenase (short-subunit alcohol dehydrogenase family)
MKADFHLEGKSALVFGGTSGIGRTIAVGLAEAGADVAPVSRRQQEVEKTAAEIRSIGRRSIALAADVTNRTQVQDVTRAVQSEFGRIDILVNSAGISGRVPSLALSQEQWDQIININLNGTWHACQSVGHVMKEQGGGRIINIGSLGSFVALYEVTPYCVSKAGVAMLTKCLAVEWAKYNINVNAIAPGVFETPLNRKLIHDPVRGGALLSRTPMKRFGQLEELVGAALYLASDLSSFTTGEILSVDGGFLAQGIGAP